MFIQEARLSTGKIVSSGIGGLVCIPITVWLILGLPEKGNLAGDLDKLGKDDLDNEAGAVAGDLDEGVLGEAAVADRLLPCWILFLVRTLFKECLLSMIIFRSEAAWWPL